MKHHELFYLVVIFILSSLVYGNSQNCTYEQFTANQKVFCIPEINNFDYCSPENCDMDFKVRNNLSLAYLRSKSEAQGFSQFKFFISKRVIGKKINSSLLDELESISKRMVVVDKSDIEKKLSNKPDEVNIDDGVLIDCYRLNKNILVTIYMSNAIIDNEEMINYGAVNHILTKNTLIGIAYNTEYYPDRIDYYKGLNEYVVRKFYALNGK